MWQARIDGLIGFLLARRPFGGSRAGTPAGVWAAFLGWGSGGVAALDHRPPAGMPPALRPGVSSGRDFVWEF